MCRRVLRPHRGPGLVPMALIAARVHRIREKEAHSRTPSMLCIRRPGDPKGSGPFSFSDRWVAPLRVCPCTPRPRHRVWVVRDVRGPWAWSRAARHLIRPDARAWAQPKWKCTTRQEALVELTLRGWKSAATIGRRRNPSPDGVLNPGRLRSVRKVVVTWPKRGVLPPSRQVRKHRVDQASSPGRHKRRVVFPRGGSSRDVSARRRIRVRPPHPKGCGNGDPGTGNAWWRPAWLNQLTIEYRKG
jgi:DNA-binding CsgD family transcriptional regulator